MQESEMDLLRCHDLIAAIVAAMEARDSHTAQHSLRVAAMTEYLCGVIGVPADLKAVYHIAAHLHDIGKIGIPDTILFKKGALTKEEWAGIRRHPVIGYEILRSIDCFSEIADIVLHHHERYDGTGYPDGLSGDAIPLCSRIIAIADSTDAMLSLRSYRAAIGEEQCRKEICMHKCAMYDPMIADAALSNWRSLMRARDTALSERAEAVRQAKEGRQ
ncbi:MAG TPA: HD domain-containing phosphohydrolase [Eubacteriales bacterium]|nr:HD domain-containing phosphohydrolase [Eubacteriales bacterium]